jgi:hypothetical protein
MRKLLLNLCCIFLCGNVSLNAQKDSVKQNEPIEILLLGTLHFSQFHNQDSETRNFLGNVRQQEFEDIVTKLSQFKPDAVFVERESKVQPQLDSLYQSYSDFTSNPKGTSELYQIGFRLAKANQLKTVYGVDYYESISQNLFKEGKNLSVFKDSLQSFQNVGRSITMRFLKGEMTISAFLHTLNLPENVTLSHRLLFNTPAYVTDDGTFKENNTIKARDSQYIGAEYISLFYTRNLKIYSNILSLQQQTQARRIVLIIGQTHVGVLQEILRNNPKFKVIPANEYLKT